MIHRTPFASPAGVRGGLLSVFLLLSGTQALADHITGQVIEIVDGDTISLLTSDDWQIHIRLASIDAPEPDQPYNDGARKTLSALTLGKHATLRVYARDQSGRSIAQVFVDGRDINHEMVRRGAAWVSPHAPTDELLSLEAEAKRNRRGLWAQPRKDIVAPWLWSRSRQQSLHTVVSSCNDDSPALDCPMRRLNWKPRDERQH